MYFSDDALTIPRSDGCFYHICDFPQLPVIIPTGTRYDFAAHFEGTIENGCLPIASVVNRTDLSFCCSGLAGGSEIPCMDVSPCIPRAPVGELLLANGEQCNLAATYEHNLTIAGKPVAVWVSADSELAVQARVWRPEDFDSTIVTRYPGTLRIDVGAITRLPERSRTTFFTPQIAGTVQQELVVYDLPPEASVSVTVTLDGESATFTQDLTPTDVPSTPQASPTSWRIRPSLNPCAAGTARFTCEVARTGRCRVQVYDVAGSRVREVLNSTLPAGRHQLTWDGRDERGTRAPAGLYFVRLESGAGERDTSKFVLLN
jgi:hypothetical protein